ncbi:hypothetical protein F383_08835 [Gossypium arboreum]|uniref:Uncharacterized protein n=1 Tax=Gossypium arboreum TaxID=29729 RepID=A0A0B0P509_GOSAR|nr:hypothetical protein F383_08835 [Gossypium arboreum]
MANLHARVASPCALKMAIHTRLLGRAKPAWYTDLYHKAKSHTHV